MIKDRFVCHAEMYVSSYCAAPCRVDVCVQDLSNLLVEEDKAEEAMGDVLSEVELLHKQAS